MGRVLVGRRCVPDADRAPVGPVRTCIGCRRPGSRAALQRWVLVDGVPTPDPLKRLPGRGAWLHDDAACRALAEKRQAFRRAFRGTGSRSAGPQE